MNFVQLLLLKFCDIFVVILILLQYNNSVNCSRSQDSNLSNGNYVSEILRRSKRQNGIVSRCEIPYYGPHVRYTILGETTKTYRPGDYSQQFYTLEVSCDEGYNLKPFSDKRTICIGGQWNPQLTINCTRTCPSLKSTVSTSVKCKYDNLPLKDCNHPVEETTAYLSCNPLYEQDNPHTNRIRLCRSGRWNPSISECYPICGTKRPKGRLNIVNGQNATLGDYPWQTGIYNARKELICGGSIIDRHIILTAAHCLTDYNGNVKSTEDYFIAAGKYYRKYDDVKDKYAQYSKVRRIYVPERYTGLVNNFALDIAVILLTDPFMITVAVQPVCIELNEESPYLHLSLNRNGIVTGWGYTVEGRELSEVLKELVIPFIPFRKCLDEVPINFKKFITSDKICGGYLNSETSICGGDSGGALVFQNTLTERYYVKGIVSTSPATEELTCDSNQYSLYTSVMDHIEFIMNILAYNQLQQSIEFTNENIDKDIDNCSSDQFTSELLLKGPNYKGCKMPCEEKQYGCCPDGVTPAHGANREGCCLDTQFGCCPDNIRPAQGSNLESCECQFSPNGCCPDNITTAQGPQHQGCPCETFQFGCCDDGVTPAVGQFRQECGCKNAEFGCCSDEETVAKGPNNTGCTCEATKYGCCLDSVYEAQGNNFEGCEETPLNLQTNCSLPKERGSCKNYTTKWFFDLDYGGCSRFWYGGCDGNSNRFKSQDDCNAVCVTQSGRYRCALPRVTGPCGGHYPKWYYDTETEACSQFEYSGCLGNNNKFETREECMELCGDVSGVETCDQPKEEGPCRGNFLKWYFDQTSERCSQFVYGGCKGNNNNFATESACRQQCTKPGSQRDYCSLLKAEGNCTGRDPRWYYNSSETRCMPFYYSGCNGNENNFVSRQACEADCPKIIENCYLDSDTGPCRSYEVRWYYDRQDGSCKQFMYGGCDGNGNNFKTVKECHDSCAAIQDLCSLPVTVGPCNGEYEQWYFSKATGSCETFKYGGCLGNNNRFEDEMSCERRCRQRQPEISTVAIPVRVTSSPPLPPVDPSVCYTPINAGNCNESIASYYFDPNTRRCVAFIYTGCNGNGNRYNSEEQCERQCCQFRQQDVCYLQPDSGLCNGYTRKYYYDSVTGRCGQFAYTGCQGNGNRFSSQEECEYVCVTHEKK